MTTKYLKSIVFLTALFFGSGLVFGQKDFTLFQTQGAFQQVYVNPAAQPDGKIHVGFPLISNLNFGASNSGFTLSDMLTVRPDDSLMITPDRVINSLNPINYLTFDTQLDLFSLGIYIGKSYLSFNISERTNFQFMYAGDLPRLLLEGNGGSLLGNRASFDNSGMNLNVFREVGLGLSTPINDKLTIGVRAKLLMGHFNVTTVNSSFGMHTDAETYALTFDGGARVNTAGFENLDLPGLTPLDIFFNNENLGIAVDLGADYKLDDKITLSASVLDLGYISWSSNVANYNIADFNYTFSGVELLDFMGGNTSALDEVIDTLNSQFSTFKTDEVYRSGLYTRFFLGGNYKINDKFNAGALVYNEFIANSLRQAVSISGGIKLKDYFTLTTNYTIFSRSYSNIGLGLIVKGGPVQFFVISDNLSVAFAPERSKNLHARFGLNLAVGKKPRE
jgi:hypothetical protein